MKGKKKYIIIGVVGIMIVLGVIASMNKPEVEETIGGYKEGPRVQVEKIKKDNIEAKISSSGKLKAVDSQTVYLDASNKIITINKEVGDTVKQGEVILVLDQEAELSSQKNLEALEAQLVAAKESLNQLLGAASKGDILSAQATLTQLKNNRKDTETSITNKKVDLSNLEKDLKQAETDLKVNEELFEAGALSQKDLDDSKDKVTTLKQNIDQMNTAITSLESSLKQMDLQIETAQYNLDLLNNKVEDSNKKQQIASAEGQIKSLESQIYTAKNNLQNTSTSVVAPINGVITYLPEEEGMPVTAGSKILTIVDPGKLEVTCDISPYYAADLRVGLDAVIKYTGSKTIEVAGKVAKVAAVADVKQSSSGETVSLPVKVEVTQPGEVIKPGFSVDVKIITDTRTDVCVAPILAVMEDDDKNYYVYVVAEDGTISRKDVKQGLSNGLYTEIEGVQEGELVVSNPADYLAEGTKVSYEKLGDEQ